jgi:hypothetical protein
VGDRVNRNNRVYRCAGQVPRWFARLHHGRAHIVARNGTTRWRCWGLRRTRLSINPSLRKRRMEKISWTDRITSEKVLERQRTRKGKCLHRQFIALAFRCGVRCCSIANGVRQCPGHSERSGQQILWNPWNRRTVNITSEWCAFFDGPSIFWSSLHTSHFADFLNFNGYTKAVFIFWWCLGFEIAKPWQKHQLPTLLKRRSDVQLLHMLV